MRYDKYLSNNTEKIEDTKRVNLEVVIRKRTDNTMAKRKRTPGLTMVYKALRRKLKIE
jgi:hypothetical protein